jgi:ATP-dependent Clp protease ATP-binding subunit ClpC
MNRLSLRANQTLSLARKEADRLNHDYVCTEHLLLGLVSLGQGGAASVLQKLGVDLQGLCLEVEKQAGTGSGAKLTESLPYTPRLKKVLALAGKEAKDFCCHQVGTEHLLVGLLREGDGVAARALRTMGCESDGARILVVEEVPLAAADLTAQASAISETRSSSQLDDVSKKLDAMMDLLGRLTLEVTDLRLALPKGNA